MFTEANSKYADAGVKIFGASADSVEENKAFKEKYSFPFELITDKAKGLAAVVGETAEKKRWAAYIEGGKVKKSWEVKNIKSFPLEALEEIKGM
jgi:peroxiredoxin Q/BCP